MERGYIKLWRKVGDSKFWSRGAVARGVLATLLVSVNWKTGYFHGKEIRPGQVACSKLAMSQDLQIDRKSLDRILHAMTIDGLIECENVGNQYTIITLTNWSVYQQNEKSNGQRCRNDMDNDMDNDLPIIKEGKKERREELRDIPNGISCPEPDATASTPARIRKTKEAPKGCDWEPRAKAYTHVDGSGKPVIACTMPIVGDKHRDTIGITKDFFETLKEAYPGVDVKQEIIKARAWVATKPANTKTRSGVCKFLRCWVDRAQNESRSGPPAQQRKTWAELEQERQERIFADFLAKGEDENE